MIAEKILSSFNNTMEEARKTLEEFAKTGKTSAMTATQALQLGGDQKKAGDIAPPGLFEGIARGWSSAAANGNSLATGTEDWATNLMKGIGWIGTAVGAVLGGETFTQAADIADLSIASTEQEARQLYSREENARRDREFSKFQKQMRETTT
jgi:hypothetical protein